MSLLPGWICISIWLVASQGAAAVASISSTIDCGCKLVFAWERMRVRRDSYLGLKGFTSCHGVYFPGTPFSRSLGIMKATDIVIRSTADRGSTDTWIFRDNQSAVRRIRDKRPLPGQEYIQKMHRNAEILASRGMSLPRPPGLPPTTLIYKSTRATKTSPPSSTVTNTFLPTPMQHIYVSTLTGLYLRARQEQRSMPW